MTDERLKELLMHAPEILNLAKDLMRLNISLINGYLQDQSSYHALKERITKEDMEIEKTNVSVKKLNTEVTPFSNKIKEIFQDPGDNLSYFVELIPVILEMPDILKEFEFLVLNPEKLKSLAKLAEIFLFNYYKLEQENK